VSVNDTSRVAARDLLIAGPVFQPIYTELRFVGHERSKCHVPLTVNLELKVERSVPQGQRTANMAMSGLSVV